MLLFEKFTCPAKLEKRSRKNLKIKKFAKMAHKLTLFGIILTSLFASGCAPNIKAAQVCCGDHCFTVEIAATPQARSRGLMHRESLPQDHGMFFIYDKEGIYPFWMKNTLIPLDIIWINTDKEVVHIKKNAQPCTEDPCESFRPEKKAKYVLEVNAGIVDTLELDVGEKLEFEIESLYTARRN